MRSAEPRARLRFSPPKLRCRSVALFVTLEGTEGCGKSTQARRLSEHLCGEGRDVVTTHEPGGTELTREIRRLLADPASQLDPRAELLLFLADRAQHVATVIRPVLERGGVVICDRYSDSTLAYQGYGRGHDLDMLERWNRWASLDVVPDLTLWIDIDIGAGLARAQKQSGGPADRFEAEPLPFHQRIHDGFKELSRTCPERIVRIDGNRGEDEVFADVKAAVEARLP